MDNLLGIRIPPPEGERPRQLKLKMRNGVLYACDHVYTNPSFKKWLHEEFFGEPIPDAEQTPTIKETALRMIDERDPREIWHHINRFFMLSPRAVFLAQRTDVEAHEKLRELVQDFCVKMSMQLQLSSALRAMNSDLSEVDVERLQQTAVRQLAAAQRLHREVIDELSDEVVTKLMLYVELATKFMFEGREEEMKVQSDKQAAAIAQVLAARARANDTEETEKLMTQQFHEIEISQEEDVNPAHCDNGE